MAYPLIHCPPWAELRENLVKNFGVKVVPIKAMPGEHFLQRVVKGKTFTYPFPVQLKDDEIVTVEIVRNLCSYLRLPGKPFGLTLHVGGIEQ